MMGGYALEFIPTWRRLILCQRCFRYFECEIIFGYTFKSTSKNSRWNRCITYNATDTETVLKGTATIFTAIPNQGSSTYAF